MAEKKPETIVIDNFTGSLTRIKVGTLNSGLAIFGQSYGFNPFIESDSLRWNPNFKDITGSLNGLVLAGKTRVESGNLFLYVITNTGHFVKINTFDDSQSDLHTLTTGNPTFNYGSSLDFFNNKVWITNDKGVSRIDFDGSNETQVGTWDSSHFIQNTFHPLVEFQGKLNIGNTTDGTVTNIGEIDTTNTITNYLKLSPALPTGTFIQDMDIETDFSYLVMSVSEVPPENLTAGNGNINSFAGSSYIFKWNGIDLGTTSGVTLPNFGIKALNFFGNGSYAFMYDFWGAAMYNGAEKIRSTLFLTAPLSNAVTAMGNFAVWGACDSMGNIFLYGKFDEETPTGLWQIGKIVINEGGTANVIPFLSVIKNQILFNSADGGFQVVANKMYISQQNITAGPVAINHLFSLSIPFPELLGIVSDLQPPQLGAYVSQRQIFENKISVKQVRVYCDPTLSGNSFEFDISGSDWGEFFTYEYVPGDDLTKLEGSLTRIDFNPSSNTTLDLSFGIFNSGTSNMTIRKVEIDWTYAGK